MGERGPKPENGLKIVRSTGQRPKPEAGMSLRARKTWRKIVESLPPGYFRPGSLPLLRAFCEAESEHFIATETIIKIGQLVKTGVGGVKANPAIAIQTAKSGEMAQLSSKLRLSVSSYRDRDVAGAEGREKPKSKRAGLMFGEV